MGFLSGISKVIGGLAPVFGAGSSLLGGITSAFGARGMSQRDLMALQYSTNMDLLREQLLRGPSWEMEGLRRAGINPMFRYGKGGSATPTMGSIGIPAPFNPLEGLAAGIGQAGTSAVSSMREASQSVLNMSSSERQRAESVRARQDALRIGQDIGRIRADTSLTNEQRRTEVERQVLLAQQAVLARAQSILPAHQARMLEQQIVTMSSQEWLNHWLAVTEGARADLVNQQFEQAVAQTPVVRAQARSDLELFDDAIVGFILRATSAFSRAIGGR